MKRLLREAGVPVARCIVLTRSRPVPTFDAVAKELGTPVFVKPANLGSSVGIGMPDSEESFTRAVAEAFRFDTKLVVEERIEGREIECSVLGNDEPRASLPGEIVTGGGHDFYDYQAKYTDENGAQLLMPAPLDPTTTAASSRRGQDLSTCRSGPICVKTSVSGVIVPALASLRNTAEESGPTCCPWA